MTTVSNEVKEMLITDWMLQIPTLHFITDTQATQD